MQQATMLDRLPTLAELDNASAFLPRTGPAP
jgi:hypothetical protein